MTIFRFNRLLVILMVGLTLLISLSPARAQTPKPTTKPIATPTITPSPKKPVMTKLPKEFFSVAWERMDPERGQLWLRFFESGKYVAGHGPLETLDGVVHSGNFQFKDGVLTFKDGWTDCNGMSFSLRLLSGNRAMYFDPVSVKCDDRSAFASKRWNRFVIKT